MKISLFLVSIFLSVFTFAQLKPGFDPSEARDMIRICNSATYLDLYGDDSAIIPEGYTKTYTSPVYGMDNLFQIYEKGDVGVISFRGSTAKKNSWLANMYATMIPAKGKMEINGDKFKYQFAKDTNGAVHAGYSLAIYYLKDDVLDQIKRLNKKGIRDIIITGHSQGGSLAQLTRVYLDHLSIFKLSKRNTFKVYSFANPMIGNEIFCKEYSDKFCSTQMSYVIQNPKDFVPKMPISYYDDFWEKNLADFILNNEEFNEQKFATDGLLNLFKGRLPALAKKFAENINKQLLKDLGEIKMPPFKDELNYKHTGNVILISETIYPPKKGEEDETKKNKLNFGGGMTLQHKPYNYYTAILKDYFTDDYNSLEQKYFVMPEK